MKLFNPRQLAGWTYVLVFIGFSSLLRAESTTTGIETAPPALSQLIQTSLADNPALIALKAELASARAGLRAADQAVYNPELEIDYEDIDGSKNPDGSIAEGTTTTSLGISQTIDWGDQRGSRTAMANARLQKALASYRLSSLGFINEVLSRQAQHQTQNELAKLSMETLNIMREFKQISERRYKAGDLNQVELNLALLAYNQALMQQANAQADASQARESLRALLGGIPSNMPALPEQLPEARLSNNLDTQLQKLPIIQIQTADLQFARQQIALRKSEKAWNPTIGIRGGKENDDSLLGFNLSIPLNVRNTFSAEVDAAREDFIATEQRAQLAFRDIRGQVIVATERYNNLLNAWNNWREHSRSSVNQQLKLIKQLWQSGDISAADYLLQLKQALETQATGLELRNQLWQVAFDWMRLTDSLDHWLNVNIDIPNQKTGY